MNPYSVKIKSERRERREKLMQSTADKQDDGLKALDVAELQKQLAELGD